MKTSAQAAIFRACPRPSGVLRSSTTLRLFRLTERNMPGSKLRAASPPGGSTLTTSAPRSASSTVVSGPGKSTEKSATLMPARGFQALMSGRMSVPLRSRIGRPDNALPEQLLDLVVGITDLLQHFDAMLPLAGGGASRFGLRGGPAAGNAHPAYP